MQTKIEDTKGLKKNIEKWVKALRSGKYKQTMHKLHDDYGYCCLGVACELFIPKNKIDYTTSGFINGGLPQDQDHAPTWLKNINSDVAKKLKSKNLPGLNDSITDPYSFDEIADILELLYIHETIEL